MVAFAQRRVSQLDASELDPVGTPAAFEPAWPSFRVHQAIVPIDTGLLQLAGEKLVTRRNLVRLVEKARFWSRSLL